MWLEVVLSTLLAHPLPDVMWGACMWLSFVLYKVKGIVGLLYVATGSVIRG